MVSRLTVTLVVASLLAAPALAGEGRAPRGEALHSDVAGALPVGTYEGAIDTGDVVYFGRPSLPEAASASAPAAKPEAARHHAAAPRDCTCHRG